MRNVARLHRRVGMLAIAKAGQAVGRAEIVFAPVAKGSPSTRTLIRSVAHSSTWLGGAGGEEPQPGPPRPGRIRLGDQPAGRPSSQTGLMPAMSPLRSRSTFSRRPGSGLRGNDAPSLWCRIGAISQKTSWNLHERTAWLGVK